MCNIFFFFSFIVSYFWFQFLTQRDSPASQSLHPLSLPTSKVLFVSARLDKGKKKKNPTRIQSEVWPYSDMASLNSEKAVICLVKNSL